MFNLNIEKLLPTFAAMAGVTPDAIRNYLAEIKQLVYAVKTKVDTFDTRLQTLENQNAEIIKHLKGEQNG